MRHFGNSGGVALFLDNAPNVQFGDFHFGAPLDSIPRQTQPLLLAWPVSNCWETNFPRCQPGRMRFRFGLRSFVQPDLQEIGRQARAFRVLQDRLSYATAAKDRS